MSYTGEMVAVVAAAALIIPIAATVSVARTAASVGKAAVDASREAARNARLNRASRELEKFTHKADALENEMQSKMDEAMAECYAEYTHSVQELAEICQKEPDTAAFAAGCRQAQKKLCQEMAEKRNTLERETISGIRQEMQVCQQVLAQERREMQASMERIAEEEARRERAGELARNTLAQTAQLLADLQLRCGDSEWGKAACETCRLAQEHAEQTLAQGLMEAALSQAYALNDAILQHVREHMERECRTMRLYADCTAMLAQLREMQKEEIVHYTFRETCSGKEREMEINDFPRYYRGAWEELQQETARMAQQLEGTSACDFAPEHLMELQDAMGAWQERFLQETGLAYERLHNLLLRRETAKLLVKRYTDEGYVLIPLTEEDKAVSDLDCRIIRLAHAETGERLYLRLNAEPDADGHIVMNIGIEDHTEYEGNFFEVERARAKERETNCELLRQSNVGKQLQLRHRCTNPGVRDTYQMP